MNQTSYQFVGSLSANKMNKIVILALMLVVIQNGNVK